MKSMNLALGLLASVALPSVALATDLEVTHWWTSGGEAAAVAELAAAFDATGNKWVDGATIKAAKDSGAGKDSFYWAGGTSKNPDFRWVWDRYRYVNWKPLN
jgi:ABC-type glycerol-3-phosphate transport system substrate-binding protein